MRKEWKRKKTKFCVDSFNGIISDDVLKYLEQLF